ncbi:MAG: polyphenol oxidase family protein [Acidimicrobiales bacterium]
MSPAHRYRFTTRLDGDFAIDSEPVALAERRRRMVDKPWTWLRQVHGSRVVTVERPGQHIGAEADGSVTAIRGAVLTVQTADCAPVVLLGDGAGGPCVGVAHAGWRGLAAGIVETVVGALRELGADELRAVVGPRIGPECYEFGAQDLDLLAARLGEDVRARTPAGRPAFDLATGVRAALLGAGVERVDHEGGCTACDADQYFSHRARRQDQRLAAVAWLAP